MKTAIKLIAYYFAYQWGFSFVTPLLFQAIGTHETDVQLYATGLTMVLSGIAMISHLVYFKYLTVCKQTLKEISIQTILLCLPLILSATLFFNLTSEWADLPNVMEDFFIALCKTPLGFISVTVMAPIVEEFLFRGTIEERLLRNGYSPTKAILVSSLIFGIIHLNPAQVPFAFCVGAVFGWLYYKTRSVVPGIVGHFFNNTCAAVMMAVLPIEEAKTSTFEWMGTIPTYTMMVIAFIVMLASFKYLNIYLSETKCKQST